MFAGQKLKEFLDEKVAIYNRISFIENDPVSIPHMFTRKQDIEIAGLFAAILAWGQRKTIIRKCTELMNLMDNEPYKFIVNHQENDLKKLISFKHRTFNTTDTLYFIYFLKNYFQKHQSLEDIFIINNPEMDIEKALINFHHAFFSLDHAPFRTRKHVPNPVRKSTCKRLNMFLRWMVRKDSNGVDFGIWSKLIPGKLICPVDLHVDKVARSLGLITRKQTDWLTALELTSNLRKLDADDPVKYDFALFGLGVIEKFKY
jgi:uncharacterized protein (TIGR02757 family)